MKYRLGPLQPGYWHITFMENLMRADEWNFTTDSPNWVNLIEPSYIEGTCLEDLRVIPASLVKPPFKDLLEISEKLVLRSLLNSKAFCEAFGIPWEKPQEKQCECGAHTTGSEAHSSWCPLEKE